MKHPLNPTYSAIEFFYNTSFEDYVNNFIKVGAVKVNATWTPEMIQDLQQQHGIDLAAELELLLVEEIRRNVDREILQHILEFNQIR